MFGIPYCNLPNGIDLSILQPIIPPPPPAAAALLSADLPASTAPSANTSTPPIAAKQGRTARKAKSSRRGRQQKTNNMAVVARPLSHDQQQWRQTLDARRSVGHNANEEVTILLRGQTSRLSIQFDQMRKVWYLIMSIGGHTRLLFRHFSGIESKKYMSEKS